MEIPLPHRARFGVFELDLKTGELRKRGRAVPLQEQPLRILIILVERRGELATREEIRRKLWPNDTAVEFDHGINTAIKKLRQALGDSAQSPKYVETVGSRGYRLLTPVEWIEATPIGAGGLSIDVAARPAVEPESEVMTGKRVSHYRVLEILGGGGMGVVYKAEDIKLGRRVALKFLPEELGKDPRTLERFEREARSASALEHPNICPIYEFGEHQDRPFIVMQMLEGQTLRERIDCGSGSLPFQIGELIDIAIQVTEGLEAAHQKGIVHRDIKPANIFLTNRGEVKILDFGLAKLTDLQVRAASAALETGASKVESRIGTVSDLGAKDLGLTQAGVALGTAAYMSPEQVRVETLDGRTDLFSFGSVLHEMAAGKAAFGGNSTAMLQSSILNAATTPVRLLNPGLPVEFEKIVTKALEKDREKRYQTAAQFRADLQSLAAGLRGQTVTAVRHQPVFLRPSVILGAALLLLATGATFWFITRESSPTSALPDLTQRQLTDNSSENAVGTDAISPDGKYLAYSDAKGIHCKVLETGEMRATPPPADLNGMQVNWELVPTWAGTITFLANAVISGQLPSIWAFSATGGPPRKLRTGGFAYSVSRDGSRVAFATKPGNTCWREMWLMGPDGKQAQKLYDADGDSEFCGAEWSPDGQRLAYTRGQLVADRFPMSVESRDLKGGRAVTIIPTPNRLQDFCWSPDRRVMFSLTQSDPKANSCDIWARRVDPRTGQPREQPKRVTNWAGYRMDGLSATADGKRLAFRKWSQQGSVYVANLGANGKRISTPVRLTLSESRNYPTAWTADSQAVLFQSNRNGKWGIYKQFLNGDEAQPIIAGVEDVYEPRISPDGAWVLYVVASGEPGVAPPLQLMRVPIAGGTPQPVLKLAFFGFRCAKSPAKLCVIAERTPGAKQLIFSAFDPLGGRGRELVRFNIESDAAYQWDLSPDGLHIAICRNMVPRLHILSLSGQAPRLIRVRGWNAIQSVFWTADGRRLLVAASISQGADLLQVDLRGNATVIWEQRGSTEPFTQIPLGGPSVPWAVPSPDGRHLAIYSWSMSANIWMIENF